MILGRLGGVLPGTRTCSRSREGAYRYRPCAPVCPVCPGSPRCLFTGTAYRSLSRAQLGAPFRVRLAPSPKPRN